MDARRLLVFGLVAAILLAGCASSTGGATGSPVISGASPNQVISPATRLASPTVLPPTNSSPTRTLTPLPTSTVPPSRQVNLQAVGDIMLGRSVATQVQAHGPGIVFAGVQSIFDSADLLVGNLECAFTTRGEPLSKAFPLAAPPETARSLALAGFDLVSLANNHAVDYGSQGLVDTLANLQENDIASVGAGLNVEHAYAPVILERNGLRLAFLAYVDVPVEPNGFDTRTWTATETMPGIAWADPARIQTDVAAARLDADVVVVLLHSGYELTEVISDTQLADARTAIDAGAALVIGSHSHIVEKIEWYHGGLIAFSLGNFVFDEFYTPILNASIILQVLLTPDGVQSFEYVPVLIENGLPEITTLDQVHGIQTLVAP